MIGRVFGITLLAVVCLLMGPLGWILFIWAMFGDTPAPPPPPIRTTQDQWDDYIHYGAPPPED